MNKKHCLIGLASLTSAFFVSAQAPVSDLGRGGIENRVAQLERILKARNQAQLEMQQQLDVLETEVNELRGTTENHSYQLEQMLQRQRELYQEIDRRFSELSQAPASLPTEVAPVASDNYSGTMSENDAYDRAVNLVLKDKRYDQAIPEFRAFLKNFPESAYAANAYYWLGQLMFYKGDWSGAKAELERVVKFYPDSNKRPDAMLKLAMVQQKLSQADEANRLYQQLIQEYPDSTAATKAKTRLQSGN